MIAHVLFNISACGFATLEPFQIHKVTSKEVFMKTLPYLAGIWGSLVVFTIIFILLALKLHSVFRWKVYRRVGADPFFISTYFLSF